MPFGNPKPGYKRSFAIRFLRWWFPFDDLILLRLRRDKPDAQMELAIHDDVDLDLLLAATIDVMQQAKAEAAGRKPIDVGSRML